jgi:hypothetical protein
MSFMDTCARVLNVLLWFALPYAVITASMSYAVGFFVGVNAIDWTPEGTANAGNDRWFAFWARIGIRRGAKQR